MNKELVRFDHGKQEGYNIMGISLQRSRELEKASAVSIWELEHPDRDGYDGYEALEAFTKHAKNTQELVFQAYLAGQFVHSQTHDDGL